MIFDVSDYLAHYGVLRRSGRYPWNTSGWGEGGAEDPTDHRSFLGMVKDLERQGLTQKEIADGFDITIAELRDQKSIARNAIRDEEIAFVVKLREKGTGYSEIGRRIGRSESQVRALLEASEKQKANINTTVAEALKKRVAEDTYIDISSGTEHGLGISETKLRSIVTMLRAEGYETWTVQIKQLGTKEKTKTKVLCPPGTTWSDVNRNRLAIKQVQIYSNDSGRTLFGIYDPLPISVDRVGVRYKEDGGDLADGVIYVRPGVKDVSIGGKNYAQVRIKVGDGHYLKGMAMYRDDLPDGVDLLFNTNKSDTGNKLDAMKKLKDDPDNPFGAQIKRQMVEVQEDGTTKLTSAVNIIYEEGDWDTWSRTLSSQMLSKQTPKLIRKQVDISYNQRLKEFQEISELTNPVVKKKLLKEFSDEVDKLAVDLSAAGIRGQATHVILPIESMSDTEIFAPKYNDGDVVALVRYPHGGVFEIPVLRVNNKHPEANKLLGKKTVDAVGINPKVAEQLSGADFDGDTVLVIPNNTREIKASPYLESLKGFDAKATYKLPAGAKKFKPNYYQKEMGMVSNLITDMTIKGASNEDIARAVKHSMVVIDADKHDLDVKRSFVDNGIAALYKKYQAKPEGQPGPPGGASTLLSRATSQARIPERKLRPMKDGGPIDPETGKLVYVDTKRIYTTPEGKSGPAVVKVDKLSIEDDAFKLASPTPFPAEKIYADYSNKLKELANRARKEMIQTENRPYSPSAKKIYAKEVARLDAALKVAQSNRPRERAAQIFGNAILKAKLAENPNPEDALYKKMKSQALNEARARMGAKKETIVFSDREWEAVQAGAITASKLSEILLNADPDQVKMLAAPKPATKVSRADAERARQLLKTGNYTRAEVAAVLGVSVTTLDKAVSGES